MGVAVNGRMVQVSGDRVLDLMEQYDRDSVEGHEVAIYRATAERCRDLMGPGQLFWVSDICRWLENTPTSFFYVKADGSLEFEFRTLVRRGPLAIPCTFLVKADGVKAVEDGRVVEDAINEAISKGCTMAFGAGKARKVADNEFEWVQSKRKGK